VRSWHWSTPFNTTSTSLAGSTTSTLSPHNHCHGTVEEEKEEKNKKNNNSTFFLLFCSFSFFFLPFLLFLFFSSTNSILLLFLLSCYYCYYSSTTLHRFSDTCSWFYHFTMVLVFTNSTINPLIYAAKYREFQHGVRRLIQRIRHPNQIQPQVDLSLGYLATNPVEHQRSAVPESRVGTSKDRDRY